MGKKYRNPPIVEALCEFQFLSDQTWDLTLPGLMYEKIKEEFPDKKQQEGIRFQFAATEKGVEQKIEPTPSRTQFYRKDKTALIQIAPDLLVINQLKPYPSWNKFKPMILNNFEKYKSITNPKRFRRIGLRYINVVEFKNVQKIKFEEYFQYYPFIPGGMLQNYSSFLMKVEFPYEDDKEQLALSLATTPSKEPDTISLVLDVDYSMMNPQFISFDKISDWLDKAHERIEKAFESCITDKLRETFEEVR